MSGLGHAKNATAASSIKLVPNPSASHPARRARAASPAPTAWPTLTAAAAEIPSGTMYVTLA